MTQTVLIGDILYPVSDTMKFTDDKVVFLNTSDIEAGKFLHKNLSDTKRLPGQAKKKIQKDDILFSEIRPINKRFAYVDFSDTERHVVSTKLMVLRSKKIVHPKYAYYWLTAPQQLAKLQAIAESRSGTFPQITFDTIKTLKVELPSYLAQIKIAEFIDSIDEKIELNRRMSETLKQMGQTLFRHYFITNPKAEKWEQIKIGEIVNTKGGGTPSTKNPDFWDGDIAWTSPRDLTGKNGVYLLNTDKTISEEGLNKISSGLLPEGSLLLSSRAPIGYIAIAGLPVAINQGYIAFLPDAYLSNHFMYFWLKHNMDRIKNAANGSTFMEISKSAFRNITTAKPGERAMRDFEAEAAELFEAMRYNQEQTQTLTILRDALLPRLISGKIKVRG